MDHSPTPPPNPAAPLDAEFRPDPAGKGSLASNFPWLAALRRRVISGLVFALPIAITIWIVYWLYSTVQNTVLDPGARLVKRMIGRERLEALPWWWQEYVSPLIAIGLALVFLYFLGHFGRTRMYRVLDWIMLRLPIVSVIFKAVRNVFASLEDRQSGAKFKRVVLVPFPNREVRSPAFVTRSMRDIATGKTVLCVYIPYCPLPTTGLILTIAEEDVTELNWDVNETMQAVISFGLSSPGAIRFHPPSGPDAPAGVNGPSAPADAADRPATT